MWDTSAFGSESSSACHTSLGAGLIALAAVMRGRRQRGSIALRLTVASLAAAVLRIASYGVMGLAQRHSALVSLFYLLPVLGSGCAIALLAGYAPNALMARWRTRTA